MTVITAIEHITLEGERWDSIAWHYYGDATAYGRIIEANPDVDMDTTLPSGLTLLIPVLSESASLAQIAQADLPPWKRDV